MWDAGLNEAQAGIKIFRRNINNLRYADVITLVAESEEELKNLLMKVKGEWESWLKTQHSKTKIIYGHTTLNMPNIVKKLRSWHPVPSLHGKCAVLSRFNCVQLCTTLWTVACQAPLFMGFSRQEYWGGFPFPPPGNLPRMEGNRTHISCLPPLVGRFFTTSITWEANIWGRNGNSGRFYFLGLQKHCRWWLQRWN